MLLISEFETHIEKERLCIHILISTRKAYRLPSGKGWAESEKSSRS